MKIKTDMVLIDFNGNPLKNGEKEITLGEVLSNIILSNKTEGKMKLYILAQKCFTENSVDVDASDFALIKSSVKNSEVYGTLVLGQVELILEDIK